jgi:hypothetical protein
VCRTPWSVLIGVLLVPVLQAQAQSAASVAPSVYRNVKTVTVAAQAEAVTEADAQLCTRFALPTRLILRVLREATEVDARTYAHDLDVAPCQACGRLQLANGLQGDWVINMSGLAHVDFEDGRNLMLHCRFCGKPFAR